MTTLQSQIVYYQAFGPDIHPENFLVLVQWILKNLKTSQVDLLSSRFGISRLIKLIKPSKKLSLDSNNGMGDQQVRFRKTIPTRRRTKTDTSKTKILFRSNIGVTFMIQNSIPTQETALTHTMNKIRMVNSFRSHETIRKRPTQGRNMAPLCILLSHFHFSSRQRNEEEESI